MQIRFGNEEMRRFVYRVLRMFWKQTVIALMVSGVKKEERSNKLKILGVQEMTTIVSTERLILTEGEKTPDK